MKFRTPAFGAGVRLKQERRTGYEQDIPANSHKRQRKGHGPAGTGDYPDGAPAGHDESTPKVGLEDAKSLEKQRAQG